MTTASDSPQAVSVKERVLTLTYKTALNAGIGFGGLAVTSYLSGWPSGAALFATDGGVLLTGALALTTYMNHQTDKREEKRLSGSTVAAGVYTLAAAAGTVYFASHVPYVGSMVGAALSFAGNALSSAGAYIVKDPLVVVKGIAMLTATAVSAYTGYRSYRLGRDAYDLLKRDPSSRP